MIEGKSKSLTEHGVRIYSPINTPFADERRPEEWDYAIHPANQTIREMVGPKAMVIAKLNGHDVPEHFIDTARIKAGAVIIVRPVPQASLAFAAAAAIAAGAASSAGVFTLTGLAYPALSAAIVPSNQFKAETPA